MTEGMSKVSRLDLQEVGEYWKFSTWYTVQKYIYVVKVVFFFFFFELRTHISYLTGFP
jgi:hypothetical protein